MNESRENFLSSIYHSFLCIYYKCMMAETARQCILAFDEKGEGNFSLPEYHQQPPPPARDIHSEYILPAGLGEKDDDLESSSSKMSNCGKTGDEVLLGLLCEKQDLCFPDFEVGDEGEVVEKCMDECSYIKMIDLNGKFHLLENPVLETDKIEKGC